MNESTNEIRGLMVTVTQGRVLIPNANVSEIITAATPEPVAQAPDWLMGQVRWRGWRVPLFSFSILAGLAAAENALNAKVIILKTLSAQGKIPYIAMLCLGFPRLTTITPDILIPLETGGAERAGVRVQVMVRDTPAFIPDLRDIEARVAQVLQAR